MSSNICPSSPRLFEKGITASRVNQVEDVLSSRTNIDITWYQGDIDGFIRYSERMGQQVSAFFHSIEPVDVTINGSKAIGVSVGGITNRVVKNGVKYELMSTCRFLSRLEKVDDADVGS